MFKLDCLDAEELGQTVFQRPEVFTELQLKKLYKYDCWRKNSLKSNFSVFHDIPFDSGICFIYQYSFHFSP